MVFFAIHRHESATGAHVPASRTPSHLRPQATPLGSPTAPALSALLHAWSLHWSSRKDILISKKSVGRYTVQIG